MIIRWLKKWLGIGTAESAQPDSQQATQQPSKGPQRQARQQADGDDAQRPKRRRNRNRKRKPKPEGPPWDISQFQVPEAEGQTRFHDLNLPDELMHAIQDLGFEYCSPIQAQILPHTLTGKDAIGKAQTGTGKTAAFLITFIYDLLKARAEQGEDAPKQPLGTPRALVVAPTRELVTQIGEDARKLCKYAQLNVVTLIGGADFNKQSQQLERRPVDIVVATPGRLIDFMNRKKINLRSVETLVLDEADRMLDMGFIPQVRRIVRDTPHKNQRQTQLFSATFSDDILRLCDQWTVEPVKVEIEPENVATDTVDQKVYLVSSEEKLDVLMHIIQQPEMERAIVFVNRRDQTHRLFKAISKAGLAAGILSGEIPQQKRTRTLEDFKQGKIRVLVATDVAGRGIHVDGISHVVNYNLPEDPEDYVHRIGRTGRAGATGISISLACEDEAFQLPDIEELLGKKFKCELPPALS